MIAAKITATGAYVPERKVTNDDLARVMDTSDEWIRSRTGIGSRHVAVGESTSHMAVKAATDVLSRSGCRAEDIQFIIVATGTPDHLFPNMACLVQEGIGASHAFCFDLNAACSGFLYSLSVAKGYIESGMYERGMVIGAETISKVVDWKERSTCVLFGDGAGAVIIEKGGRGIGSMVMGADGKGGEVLRCSSSSILCHDEESRRKIDYLHMDGQEVFRFAARQVPAVIEAVLEKEGLEPDQIGHYILHQANERIIASVARKMKEPMEKFPVNLDRYGNTSSASIPILLHELHQTGALKNGEKLILAGFGAGLTWGAAMVEWNI